MNNADPPDRPITEAYSEQYLDHLIQWMEAARKGETSTLERLLDSGLVSVDTRYPRLEVGSILYLGETALIYACQNSRLESVRFLLGRGADVHIRTGDRHNHSLLHVVVQSGCRYRMGQAGRVNLDLAHLLVAHGLDPNEEDFRGQTPIMLAVLKHLPDMVGLLLALGSNPNHRSHAGQTPLFFCFTWGSNSIGELENAVNSAKALVEAGANLDILDSVGESPLRLSIRNGHYQGALFLLMQNCDPDFPRCRLQMECNVTCGIELESDVVDVDPGSLMMESQHSSTLDSDSNSPPMQERGSLLPNAALETDVDSEREPHWQEPMNSYTDQGRSHHVSNNVSDVNSDTDLDTGTLASNVTLEMADIETNRPSCYVSLSAPNGTLGEENSPAHAVDFSPSDAVLGEGNAPALSVDLSPSVTVLGEKNALTYDVERSPPDAVLDEEVTPTHAGHLSPPNAAVDEEVTPTHAGHLSPPNAAVDEEVTPTHAGHLSPPSAAVDEEIAPLQDVHVNSETSLLVTGRLSDHAGGSSTSTAAASQGTDRQLCVRNMIVPYSAAHHCVGETECSESSIKYSNPNGMGKVTVPNTSSEIGSFPHCSTESVRNVPICPVEINSFLSSSASLIDRGIFPEQATRADDIPGAFSTTANVSDHHNVSDDNLDFFSATESALDHQSGTDGIPADFSATESISDHWQSANHFPNMNSRTEYVSYHVVDMDSTHSVISVTESGTNQQSSTNSIPEEFSATDSVSNEQMFADTIPSASTATDRISDTQRNPDDVSNALVESAADTNLTSDPPVLQTHQNRESNRGGVTTTPNPSSTGSNVDPNTLTSNNDIESPFALCLSIGDLVMLQYLLMAGCTLESVADSMATEEVKILAEAMIVRPRTLMESCRAVVRRTLRKNGVVGSKLNERVYTLLIPGALKDFLLMKESNPMPCSIC